MDKERIGQLARQITLVIVGIVGVLQLVGVNVPIVNENTVTAVISAVIYIAVLVWNHYKNNDYTIEGRIGTSLTRELKANRSRAGSGNILDEDAISHEINDPADYREEL